MYVIENWIDLIQNFYFYRTIIFISTIKHKQLNSQEKNETKFPAWS